MVNTASKKKKKKTVLQDNSVGYDIPNRLNLVSARVTISVKLSTALMPNSQP